MKLYYILSLGTFLDEPEYKYHGFQVVVPAFGKECFYQLFSKNTSLTVIWHVVKAGGTGELAAVVTVKQHPDIKTLYTSAYGQMGEHRAEHIQSGVYEVCIENESSYVSKTVYLWIDYLVERSWDSVIDEDADVKHFQLKKDLIRDILRTLEYRLHDMAYYQTVYREKNSHHERSLLGLSFAVDMRSFGELILMVVTSVIQVAFVRKLFSSPAKTTNKPT